MVAPLCPTKPGTLELQRFLGHHIDQARKALQGPQPLSDTAVHEARKQLKKARADLRLLRKALGPQTYAYENRALRDTARPLSLAVLMTRRRMCLQEEAMTLGHCLYADPPRLFVERLRAYWRASRGKAA
ncbi:MAG TPA: CHAD domain-containing protein [Candidatus Tectomicrobia bacterium]